MPPCPPSSPGGASHAFSGELWPVAEACGTCACDVGDTGAELKGLGAVVLGFGPATAAAFMNRKGEAECGCTPAVVVVVVVGAVVVVVVVVL